MRKLKKVYVEITNQCNLSCSFCHKTKRKKDFLSPEAFADTAKKVKEATDYIYLHVMGEPLLHPNLEEILLIANGVGLFVNITTNGVLLEEKKEILFRQPAVRQINFSLHSFAESGLTVSPENYMQSLFSFVRERKDNKPIVCYRFWNLSKEGKKEENEMLLSLLRKEYPGTALEEAFISGNGRKIGEALFIQQTYPFVWPDQNGPCIRKEGACFGLKDHVGILCDGTVVPCCLDCEGDLALGNIRKDSLNHILESERARNMAEGFRQNKLTEPFCQTCGWNF